MEEVKENKSIVTSYRLAQDTKEKLQQQLKDLGMTQEQYFNKVVSVMEIENVKQNSFLSKDTTIIQSNLDAILNSFISIADSSNNLIGNKDVELQELKEKYKDMLFTKDGSITQQKQELQEVYNKLIVLQTDNDNNNNKLMKQLDQMKNNLEDKTSLIAEYKTKNDDLLGIVSEYKQYKEEVDQYKKLLVDSQSKNISLVDSIKEKDNRINNLNKAVEELNTKHTEELKQSKGKEELVKEKAILLLQKEHQQELQQIQEKFNKEVEEYQDRYKDLLNKLEKQEEDKKTKVTRKKSKVIEGQGKINV